MADINRTVSVIFKGDDQLSRSVDGISRSLSNVNTDAELAEQGLSGLGDQAENLGSGAKNVEILGRALQALATGLVVERFISANVAAEQFQRTMTFVSGSTQAAAEEFEYLQNITDLLGLRLLDATTGYAQLSAATKNTAIDQEETRKIFEAVSTAAANLGLSSADTEAAFRAITQIVSKGVVSMEELRQQLGERIPGAFQIAAESVGLTTQEFNDLVATGSLLAEDFLPAFADGISDAFGDPTRIDTYVASFNRLQNAIDGAAIQLGEGGAFDFAKGVITTLTASIVGAVAAVELWGTTLGLVFGALSQGDFALQGDAFKESWQEALDAAADSVRGVNEDFYALFDSAESVQSAFEDIEVTAKKIPTPIEVAAKALTDLAESGEKANKLLKDIGVDKDFLTEPVEQTVQALQELLKLNNIDGQDILQGLVVTLDKLQNDDYFGLIEQDIRSAFENGRIESEIFVEALQALADRGSYVSGEADNWSESWGLLAKQLTGGAEASDKAAQAAKKTALELEKIASNERIKTIEASVNLNIAQLESDTEKALAVFDNLGTVIQTTSDGLGGLFALFGSSNVSLRERFQIEDQIELENERRAEALELQKELTKAQIAQLKARNAALQRGDALITVDGAGLQPHLEAFMFEVLEAVQVRVNAEGLDMLVGV